MVGSAAFAAVLMGQSGCPTTGTYHFRAVDAEDDFAYTPIAYSGGSVLVATDFRLDEVSSSGGIELGLFRNNQSGNDAFHLIVGLDGGGKHFTLGAEGMGEVRQNFDYQLGNWYRATMIYSEASATASLVVEDLSSGAVVTSVAVSGGAIAQDLTRFGVAKQGGDGIGHGVGEIDNVRVVGTDGVLLEVDFGVDPGFVTTDPTDFYWNASGE
ncbi:MAG: hypothetical protein U0610_16650 [bacterium]